MSGYAAYQKTQIKNENPRDLEYRLLGQVTASLIDAQKKENEGSTTNAAAKAKAILWNRDIWSTLKIDLMDSNNALPKDLRGNLISLAIFIEKETFAILDGTSDIEILIELNQTIMEGLKPANKPDSMPEVAVPPPVPSSF